MTCAAATSSCSSSPPIGHVCLKDGVTSGCALCLSNTEEACRVLVKVADMGICANPATQKTINKQGIRRFIPECLNFVATLTNKVCTHDHSMISHCACIYVHGISCVEHTSINSSTSYMYSSTAVYSCPKLLIYIYIIYLFLFSIW